MEKNSLASGTFLRTCVCKWLDNNQEKYDKRCMNELVKEYKITLTRCRKMRAAW